MKFKSIIPKLHLKGKNLIKTIYYDGLRVLGKPEEYAKHYFEDGCDEIIVHDVVAHLLNQSVNLETINKISEQIFVPITVGGGVKNIKDIENILNSGASKVSINTHALENPDFINEAANIFGSSTITVSIDAGLVNNEYFAFALNGRTLTSKKVLDWSKEVEERGAGEIIISSIDKDGTGEGYDLDLLKNIKQNCCIRIIGNSGAKSYDDVINLFEHTNLDAACLSSSLHYSYLKNTKKVSKYEDEGNSAFLDSKNKNFKNFKNISITELKNKLSKKKIYTRI